jgi:stage II sporulation SpoAA-like protein
MFELIEDLPDDVLGISAVGHVDAQDYRDTLIPEALRRIERHRSLRVLYYLGPRFEGMTSSALWADMKLGVRHWGDFGRMAIVTDVDWIMRAVKLFAPLFHHPVRVFSNSELQKAKVWIGENAVRVPICESDPA